MISTPAGHFSVIDVKPRQHIYTSRHRAPSRRTLVPSPTPTRARSECLHPSPWIPRAPPLRFTASPRPREAPPSSPDLTLQIHVSHLRIEITIPDEFL